MEEKKEDCINPENYNQNIDNLPEPEITENEMKEIIDFINNWDYEKYERDSEVREALLLLRSKMKKEEEEKAQQLEELRIKEKNAIINNNIKEENKNDNNREIKELQGNFVHFLQLYQKFLHYLSQK